jgi:hypothetical protein
MKYSPETAPRQQFLTMVDLVQAPTRPPAWASPLTVPVLEQSDIVTLLEAPARPPT